MIDSSLIKDIAQEKGWPEVVHTYNYQKGTIDIHVRQVSQDGFAQVYLKDVGNIPPMHRPEYCTQLLRKYIPDSPQLVAACALQDCYVAAVHDGLWVERDGKHVGTLWWDTWQSDLTKLVKELYP